MAAGSQGFLGEGGFVVNRVDSSGEKGSEEDMRELVPSTFSTVSPFSGTFLDPEHIY